jgi:hypothetical protein
MLLVLQSNRTFPFPSRPLDLILRVGTCFCEGNGRDDDDNGPPLNCPTPLNLPPLPLWFKSGRFTLSNETPRQLWWSRGSIAVHGSVPTPGTLFLKVILKFFCTMTLDCLIYPFACIFCYRYFERASTVLNLISVHKRNHVHLIL